MRTLRIAVAIVTLGIIIPAYAAAEEKPATAAMPEMGAPKEITEMAWIVGTWDVVMKSKWDPASENWEEAKGTAIYSYCAGGSAIMMVYDSQAMGMPFAGFMLETYDRETKMWQAAWTDNFGARISTYTGKKENGKIVLSGEDLFQGMKTITRMTTSNVTPTKFDWTMESSTDGGKTFFTAATAVYTKRK